MSLSAMRSRVTSDHGCVIQMNYLINQNNAGEHH